MTARRFPLAKMDGLIRGLTYFLLALPIALAVLSKALGGPGPIVASGLLVLYGVVALVWRPLAFEVVPGAVVLRYPVRTKRIALGGLAKAEVLTAAEFQARFGLAVRVGVGGLWGGFGWLRTSNGWVEMDLSRRDGLVLLSWPHRIPLLVTPESPEAFVEAVRAATP